MEIDFTSGVLWEGVATTIFTLIGILLFVRLWKYVREEMKTVQNDTKIQKFKTFLGAFLFSIMISVAIVFVGALVMSAIAINALNALENIENTIWTEEMIRAFQFPRFLPITLIIITGFAIIYPFYEYLLMGRRSDDAPMEIQRWIDSRIIDRFDPPWSYIVAFLLFVLIVLAVPTVISLYFIYVLDVSTLGTGNISPTWVAGLIFADWVLIGPIFYLTYYSKIGTVQTVFRGFRINMKKDISTAIFFIIAIISILSTVVSFFQYVPILWGQSIEYTTNYAEAQGGFLEQFVEFILQQNPSTTTTDWERWNLFSAIVPLDFLLFFISTCGFGLLGFYLKFLNKEPLNRTPIVIFAAYIICGIAFTIFINAMIKWPWIFPSQNLQDIGLNLNLTDPADQELLIRFFSPAILIEKVLNMGFLAYFLFGNKEIRRNIDESILNKAITNQNLKIIAKYRLHRNPELRKLVVSALANYTQIKTNIPPEEMEYIGKILADLALDKDITVRQNIAEHLFNLTQKLNKNAIAFPFKAFLEQDVNDNTPKVLIALKQILQHNEEQFNSIFTSLNKQLVPQEIEEKIFGLIQDHNKTHSSFVQQTILPLLDAKEETTDPKYIAGALEVIKNLLPEFESKYESIIIQLEQLLQFKDSQIKALALNVYGNIVVKSPQYFDRLVVKFKTIHDNHPEINRQRLGTIGKLISIKPETITQFIGDIDELYNMNDAQIRTDMAISIGSFAQNTTLEQFIDLFFPYFTKLVLDENTEVKRAIIPSMLMLVKTREDIYHDERMQRLILSLLMEPEFDLRNLIYDYLRTEDPRVLLSNFVDILKQELKSTVRIEILNYLCSYAKTLTPVMLELGMEQVLFQQKFSNDSINPVSEKDKDIFQFGFPSTYGSITEQNATLALCFELAYYSAQPSEKLLVYLRNSDLTKDDFNHAYQIRIWGRAYLDPNKLESKPNGVSQVSFDVLVVELWNMMLRAGSRLRFELIEFLIHFYELHPAQHNLIISLLIAIKKIKKDWDAYAFRDLLMLMGKIISDQKLTYFEKVKIRTIDSKDVTYYNPITDVFGPIFLDAMKHSHPFVQTAFQDSIKQIGQPIDNDPKPLQLEKIRPFLVKNLDSAKSNRVRIAILNALLAIPDPLTQYTTMQTLMRTRFLRDQTVRILTFTALGKAVKNFPIITTNIRSLDYTRLRQIVHRAFFLTYTPDLSLAMKSTLMDQLEYVVLNQPKIQSGIRAIKKMTLDPIPNIAKRAIDLYCIFVIQNPEKKQPVFADLRNFANNTNPQIQLVLFEKIHQFFTLGYEIDTLLPTLIKLGASAHGSVRQKSFEIFRELYLKNNKRFLFFIFSILRLTQNRRPQVRIDACRVLFNIIFEKTDELQEYPLIFSRFQVLARDTNRDVVLIIASYLVKLTEAFPNRINSILQIIYSLIRESDNEILYRVFDTIKVIIQKDPAQKKQIKANLQRFYRKSQNPMLATMLKEIQ